VVRLQRIRRREWRRTKGAMRVGRRPRQNALRPPGTNLITPTPAEKTRTAKAAVRACIFFFPCICILFFRRFPRAMNLAWGKRSAAALLGGRARQRPESTRRFSWGITVSVELVESGGGGRSALRPGRHSRACRVDRPPALFSHAEENPRPCEPAYSSSTGDGSGSGGPDRKHNSRRVL